MATPPLTEHDNLFIPPVPIYQPPANPPAPPIVPPEHYLIEVSAFGPGPIMPVRIRRWLKSAKRGYGLRCISCMQLPKEGNK